MDVDLTASYHLYAETWLDEIYEAPCSPKRAVLYM